MLKEHLKSLGLGDYEAAIYEVLLTDSPVSATHIAKKCRLSRSSVYTSLNSLIGKGLVGTSYKNEVKQFVAEDLEALKQLIRGEERQLALKKTVLEDVELAVKALSHSAISVPEVVVFEGQDGLKKIYMSMLRQAQPEETMKIIRDEFVWQEEWGFVFGREWHDRIKRMRQEKNIRTKLLINDSVLEKKKLAYYKSRQGLEMRRLPASSSVNKFALYILGDIVSILSMENNNLVGIKISNRHLADNYRQLFDNLWRNGK
ncbi:hypothetical protein HGA34_05750 [Candidatus Falkowbacteria bacterium]|nr:hypothetical protein [Candidatus Falkowbacteria bacterium]